MTKEQMTAIGQPCTYAEQCNNPRFFQSVGYFGVGLTVNTGEE